MELSDRIARAVGASHVASTTRVAGVWGGYGEVLRCTFADHPPVVVKHIKPKPGTGRGHSRKLRSYDVELVWYRDWSQRCSDACRVPRAHGLESDGTWLFVLEDLDHAGFAGRSRTLPPKHLEPCLRWLAHFHATFLGEAPHGLWETGTYWHLDTRPDELASMPDGPLRRAAQAIDAKLSSATHQTLVHGDAKPANFCFADGGAVAAVDFQYVGGGCGIKDVAYLLAGESRDTFEQGVDAYFAALADVLDDSRAIETEWRGLLPWAVADFRRFMAGWGPGWRRDRKHEREMTETVLALCEA